MLLIDVSIQLAHVRCSKADGAASRHMKRLHGEERHRAVDAAHAVWTRVVVVGGEGSRGAGSAINFGHG